MKLLSTLAASLLVASSIATTASADDKATPELLIGLSDTQVEALSADDSAETRGEKIRIPVAVKPGWCGWRPCAKTVYGTITVKVRRGNSTYYVKH